MVFKVAEPSYWKLQSINPNFEESALSKLVFRHGHLLKIVDIDG